MDAILYLGALYGIYKTISYIMSQYKCPDDKILREVVLGITRKNTATADRVIRHLGVCDKCQEKAKEIGSN